MDGGELPRTNAVEDRMRRRPVLIAVSVLALAISPLCGRPASAQSQAPTQAQSPPPSPDTVAAARELVTTSRAADQLKTLLPLIMQQLKPAIVQGRADVARDFDAAMPQLIEAMSARSDSFAEAIAVIYARHFSADELRQVTAFYRSPIGQRFLEKMPTIAQESMTMGQKFGQEIAVELRTRMIEELRKRGHDI
jgi:hypothetical protein